MVKTSAGLLMYKIEKEKLLVFLIHPGGPFWKNKEIGVWGIPKGEADNNEKGEELLNVAKREFYEETGIDIPINAGLINLGSILQKSGKKVHAWAFENNNKFKFECKSFVEMIYHGEKIRFPETDKGEFFDIENALRLVHSGQDELISRLVSHLGYKNKKEEQKLLV